MKQPSAEDKERFQHAMQALNGGEPEEAIRLFEAVRQSWRDDADIHYLEGLAYGKLGNPVKVMEVSEQALALAPVHIGALCNLANAQMLLGNPEAALENYGKALKLDPDAPGVHESYGRALGMLGRREEAVEHYKKALETRRDFAPAHASLGRAYAEGGDPESAMNEYSAALRLDPEDYQTHIGLAGLHTGLGGLPQAEQHYKEAIRIESRLDQAYIGLAGVECYKGHFDQALDLLDQADQRGTINDSPRIQSLRADCLERIGKADQAYGILEKLAEENRMPPAAVVSYSNLCHQFGVCDEALELIDLSAAAPATNAMDKKNLFYAAGALLDKLGRYDEAMDYYRRANETVKSPVKHDTKTMHDNLIRYFSKEAMARLPRAQTSSSRPVFIVGMPRSGTTLTEQILASHPAVFGAGELADIKRLTQQLLEPGAAQNLDYASGIEKTAQSRLTEIANNYLGTLQELDSEARFVTDKMPHNFQHLGLIALLFPEARIIHCQRNPLDNGLSIYFQNFIWTHDYANDLASIGRFYSEYERLMRHWKAVIDIPMLTVQYEDMIEDQEGTSRQLLEFCGLDWDDAVMQFHRSQRTTATASYNQVRQPIYKTSHGRWKNYARYLTPLKKALPAHCVLGIEDIDLVP